VAKEDFADHAPVANDHTVVVFDHRGHGESDKPDDPLASPSAASSPTRSPSRRVGLSRFRLLGHSMGAWSPAGSCSTIGPGRALVLMDTAPVRYPA
jgi:pimeloyl-ACP methyl ester carboxylesterase